MTIKILQASGQDTNQSTAAATSNFKLRTSNFILFFLLASLVQSQTLSIATARSQAEGSTVTVRGIVTNGAELGKIRYMQDGSAGIAAFPGTGSATGFEAGVKLGDSIEVTGKLLVFNQLLEISPILSYKIIAPSQPLPVPKPVSLGDLNESLEGQLLSVSCTDFNTNGTFINAGTFGVTDGGGHLSDIYLRSGHPLLGTTIPVAPVRLVAILSQYDDDFQLLPRTTADFVAAPCFFYENQPEQGDIQQNSFLLNWRTNAASTAKIRYGTTPALGNEVNESSHVPSHTFQLNGLQPGTIYWVQIVSERDGEQILSEKRPFATRSASSGQIKVFFNHSIDLAAANGLQPDGQSFQAVLAETLARINAAQQTIDVAMYNVNRNDLIAALKSAHQRGVRVRYVGASATENYALDPPPPFGFILGNANSLMHDKFMIVDAALPDKTWVMSGSMNWTNSNMTDDYNNTLFIQDQSLARTYTLEFEEMFGSMGNQPDLSKARFGAAKHDNTPHRFVIGGRPVESWFSPSDQVTRRITDALKTAQKEVLFALFVFTKEEQAEAIVQAHVNGAKTRGMIDDTSIGSEYDYLLGNFVQVQPHPASAILHHKYAVVDAGQNLSDPTVVTGSHNWTFTAETANDENTLVIHDANIATLFKAEFEKRWSENTTSTVQPNRNTGVYISPNPAGNETFVKGLVRGSVSVRDVSGKEWLYEIMHSSGTTRLDAGILPPGSYFASIQTPDGVVTLPFQKI